jgi:hypothetical protein
MSDIPQVRKADPREARSITALAMRSKAYRGYPEEFMDACRDESTVTADVIDAARYYPGRDTVERGEHAAFRDG